MNYSLRSTDEILINGCRQQNRLAQKYLYQKYYGRMVVICKRYTSNEDEAIDVLNRAFLKIFNSIGDYKATGTLSGWMARIVFITAIDYIRSNQRYNKAMDFNTERDVHIAPEIMDTLVAEDLYKALEHLPDTVRAVFSLYVLDGYKHREIAEILNISINTSKWHLSTAKKNLQQLLKNYDRSRIAI
ncbi:MAG: sigma-70 family RNA polymerase sigma factor [Bacteroidota bacterium]